MSFIRADNESGILEEVFEQLGIDISVMKPGQDYVLTEEGVLVPFEKKEE